MDNIEVKYSDFSNEQDFQQLVVLQKEVYPNRYFSVEGFKNWYMDNPSGRVVSYNAWDKGKMIAHYACIPKKMVIDGNILIGLHSMATVTHPDYRGKGLFKFLADRTYTYAQNMGYKFVIGVANANSYPGFIKHFPFKLISQLDVKVGIGTRIYPNNTSKVYTYWDEELIRWRSHGRKYNFFSGCIIGKYSSLINTFMGRINCLSEGRLNNKKVLLRPCLYVGIGSTIKSPYINVPKFIKRSPFNLIFMDLTDGELPIIKKEDVCFQLIDFDVA